MKAGVVEISGEGFIDLHEFAKKSTLLTPLKNIVLPREGRDKVENGTFLWESKSFKDSLKSYLNNDSNSESYVNKIIEALNYFGLGKNNEALNLLEGVASQKSNRDLKILSLLVSSTIHVENNDFKKAIILTTKVLEINPKFYKANYILGLANARLNRYDQAIKNFKKSLKGGENINEIKANLAYSYFKNKNFLKSFWMFRRISSRFENNYKVLYQIGISCLAVGRYRDANRFFNRTVELNQNFAGVFLTRGYLRLKLGDAIGAQNDLLTAEKLGSKKASNLLRKYNNPIKRLVVS